MTTATGERSFSALKYIKNYLRSTVGEERLNGLAHMYINLETLNWIMIPSLTSLAAKIVV